jgi:hypothetical protein
MGEHEEKALERVVISISNKIGPLKSVNVPRRNRTHHELWLSNATTEGTEWIESQLPTLRGEESSLGAPIQARKEEPEVVLIKEGLRIHHEIARDLPSRVDVGNQR